MSTPPKDNAKKQGTTLFEGCATRGHRDIPLVATKSLQNAPCSSVELTHTAACQGGSSEANGRSPNQQQEHSPQAAAKSFQGRALHVNSNFSALLIHPARLSNRMVPLGQGVELALDMGHSASNAQRTAVE